MDDHQQLHNLKYQLSEMQAVIEAANLDEDLKELARDALLAWVGGQSSKEGIEDIEVTKAEREWLEDATLVLTLAYRAIRFRLVIYFLPVQIRP